MLLEMLDRLTGTTLCLQKWLQALTICFRSESTNKSNLSLDSEIAGVFAKVLGVWPYSWWTLYEACTQYPTVLK